MKTRTHFEGCICTLPPLAKATARTEREPSPARSSSDPGPALEPLPAASPREPAASQGRLALRWKCPDATHFATPLARTLRVRTPRLALALLLLSTLHSPLSTFGQGTAFTYQGRLFDNGNSANGSYDLVFSLYGLSSSGSAVAGPLTNSATGVSNGLFTVTLDFGSGIFQGSTYWLDISVRTNGNGALADLSPRQEVTPSPYSIFSENSGVATSVSANGVSALQLNTTDQPASGQVLEYIAGNLVWTNPTSGSGWSLTGNSGTTPGVNFLGTSDNEPLELWVNGGRALRLEPGSGSANVIGGSSSSADVSVGGGTIAGGIVNTVSNLYPTVSGGEYNKAVANGAVVGGGYDNTASGKEATVSGGAQNNASGAGAFVGGGGYDGTTVAGNTAAFPGATAVGGLGNTALGNYATVVGGYSNIVNGFGGFVGGGQNNNATISWSFVGGGLNNHAGSYYAAVVGGQGNQATGTGSFVGGGGYDGFSSGANTASGAAATVPGGWGNSAAGNYGFAAGHQAQAQNQGAFVWADSQNGAFPSTANDQFSVRANGGVRFITGPNGVSINGQPVLTGASSGAPPTGWSLTGNTNTDPSVNYLGTADGAGLELRVNGLRGMRLDYVIAGGGLEYYDGINANGGYWGNAIGSGFAFLTPVVGGTIAGGGYETLFNTYPNYVTGDFGSIGGGFGNNAGPDAVVPGGYNNVATGDGSFAAGRNAQTTYDGNFVWSDGTATFQGSGVDRFEALASGGVGFYKAPAASTLRILSNGFIGINTNTPNQQLEVNGEFMLVDGLGHESAYLGGDGSGDDVQIGSLNPAITAVSCYNAATSQYMHLYVSSITIEGGSDLAEPFQISTADQEIPPGAVVVIDEANPGHLKVSDQPYDSRVAGVVSGANGIHPGIQMQQQGLLEGGQNVALTGRVYVQADASNGVIKPGDLLTTSATPGHAMKVSDHAKAQGAILGKAMTGLSEGKGMVLVLVTLQ